MKNLFRKEGIVILILILFIGISIGYANLSTGLNIVGTTNIMDNRWDIYFDNVQVKSGSVNSTEPAINSDSTEVSFNVTLNSPGDYYEFTVDAVNDGSIDAMIDSFSSKVNGMDISNLPNCLEYTVTNDDGSPIVINHILQANDSDTYKIKVKFKEDLSESDLYDTMQTITLSFEVNYVQKTSAGISGLSSYTFATEQMFIGSALPNGVTVYNDYNSVGKNYFFGFNESNGKVSDVSVGFILNSQAYFIKGGVDESLLSSSPVYDANKAILDNAFGSQNCSENGLSSSDLYYDCNLGNFYASASKNGAVGAGDNDDPGNNMCKVYGNGEFTCT